MGDQTEICERCGREVVLTHKKVTVYRHRGGQHFIFEQVPARVCDECGYQYFSITVVAEMEHLMNAPETLSHAQPVPVVPFGIH